MAKHGHIRDHGRLLERPPRPAARADGHGWDYKYFRTLPTAPPEAYYLRRGATIRAALQEVRRQPVPTPLKRMFQERIDDLLRILGPFPYDFGQARGAFSAWSQRYPGASPQQRDIATLPSAVLVWELQQIVPALLLAYEDPKSFFEVFLRERYPSYFDSGIRMQLGYPNPDLYSEIRMQLGDVFSGVTPAENFGRLLWTWGYGALLNADVAFVFNNLHPDVLREALALAEGRTGMREGRPKGAKDGRRSGKPRASTLAVRARNEAVERSERAERAKRADSGSTGRSIAKVARETGSSFDTVKKGLYRKRH